VPEYLLLIGVQCRMRNKILSATLVLSCGVILWDINWIKVGLIYFIGICICIGYKRKEQQLQKFVCVIVVHLEMLLGGWSYLNRISGVHFLRLSFLFTILALYELDKSNSWYQNCIGIQVCHSWFTCFVRTKIWSI